MIMIKQKISFAGSSEKGPAVAAPSAGGAARRESLGEELGCGHAQRDLRGGNRRARSWRSGRHGGSTAERAATAACSTFAACGMVTGTSAGGASVARGRVMDPVPVAANLVCMAAAFLTCASCGSAAGGRRYQRGRSRRGKEQGKGPSRGRCQHVLPGRCPDLFEWPQARARAKPVRREAGGRTRLRP